MRLMSKTGYDFCPVLACDKGIGAKWKHYVIGHHFIIKTDHQSLKHILEQKVDNALQQRWISKLLGLDYEVQYKRGRDKKVADALSRKEHGDCSTITVVIPNWIIEAEHLPYPGLLQPLAIPTQAWSSILMDFIEGLPKSEGKDCILVVVDRLTKYAHFIALTHPFSTESVARTFIDSVYKLHGLPVNIISDRDEVFTGVSWRELFKLLGTTLSLSTAYHPHTNGQTERVNQCVENYLRCMCHLRPKQWNRWLSLIEFWYNTNFHTSLKLNPIQALYGYHPGPLTIDPYIPATHPEVEEYLRERMKVYPAKVLSRRLILRRNTAVPQLLVQWENYSETDTIWENYYDIVAKFPEFEIDPQRRGSSLPGGDVTAMTGERRPNLHLSSSRKWVRQIKGEQRRFYRRGGN
ncbi:Transposon Ty3-G Gag-Pol polyprotein [Sesamum angolense]|uniref:Transposon Ty3-G Gag-Pol polyprotein n=1 Tax=Sesamum angolense TaxID=2727404 RepID=A0AAE1TAD4_9LAMI|nr:Transposon Ty3-G Gag-Pol polyprotein [Sesamum angolense]